MTTLKGNGVEATAHDPAAMSPQQTERLRQTFKRFNPLMIMFFRAGLGKLLNMGPERLTGRYMVITHTGRKTGQVYRTPVNFTEHEGYVYCLAGFGQVSDWYRNIMAKPNVEVWLPDGWWAGKAEDVSDMDGAHDLLRRVLVASGFAARMFDMDPEQLSDEELAALTREYRLVRIRRTEARTGLGGPNEFAWIWPLATFLLLLRPRPRRRTPPRKQG
jgi:deazaflavin-dependent oxidoreductase (nitroreductase family)